MLILGLILFGMLVGAGAQLILGRSAKGIDWAVALVAGLVGSFVGRATDQFAVRRWPAVPAQRHHRVIGWCAAGYRGLALVPPA